MLQVSRVARCHGVPRRRQFSALANAFYNEEQKELQKNVKKLIDTHVNPYCDQWEKDQLFPAHKVFKIFGDAGYLGITKPVEYGGQGLDYKFNMAFIEAMGHVRAAGVSMGLGVQTDCATPALARFGSHDLKEKYLVPALRGDQVCCVGVSEPSGGSDVSAVQTRAVRDGEEWVINGQKMWITNSLQADWMCALVNTNDGKIYDNKSLIIIPMDAEGVVKAKKIDKMGMHSSDTGLIYFDNVRVPVTNTIGEEGSGFLYQMLQFQEERLAAALGCLTPLDACLEETIQYTRERKAFGKSILDNQYVHFRLAELKTEIELLRAGIYSTADSMEAGADVTMMASMLKLKSGRLCREVTDSCLQFWGGMGFTNDVLVSRMYRDLRLWSIGGGADEVMLGIICKYMGMLPTNKRNKG